MLVLVQVVRACVGIRRRIRMQAVGLRMGSRYASGYCRLLVGSIFDTGVDIGVHYSGDN